MLIVDWIKRALIFYKEGGEFMHPIAAVGIFAVWVFVERLLYMYRSGINANHFMARIQSFLIANNVDEAIKFCNSASEKPLARIIKAGLIRADKGETEVVHALEVASLEEIPKIQRWTAYLPMCANVATLLGLLGTIIGIIMAFSGLNTLDPALRQTTLAAGIAIAMHCTAMGLIFGIPSLLFFSIIQQKSARLMDDIDKSSMKLIDLLKTKDTAKTGTNN